jgi:CheY-like chemotaxis protein
MSKKIIAVEDSPNLQKILKLIFTDTEFDFELCVNYEELTQNYKMSNYDLLLLDFSISSNIDGYTLCRNIKRDHPGLKIIIMFGTFDSPDKDKLIYSGADEHIYKPFDSEKLLKLCQKMTKESLLVSAEHSRTNIKLNEREFTVPEIMISDFSPNSSDDTTWGSIDVPSVIGGESLVKHSAITSSRDEVIQDQHTEYHAEVENDFLEKTAVIDLDLKKKNEQQNIQKIQEIIGNEKNEDLWTFDGVPSKAPKTHQMKVDKDKFFETVDQEVLKRELMTEFKRTIIYEVKDEVVKILLKSLKEEIVDRKQDFLDLLAKEIVSDMKSSLNEKEIKESIVSSIEGKITRQVKEEIPGVLTETIEVLANRAAQSMLEKKMSSLIPDLAEDLIKKDLASIRKQVM